MCSAGYGKRRVESEQRAGWTKARGAGRRGESKSETGYAHMVPCDLHATCWAARPARDTVPRDPHMTYETAFVGVVYDWVPVRV